MASDTPRIAAAAALVVLTAALSWGISHGRAGNDLLFYACAFSQAGTSLVAGRLAVGSVTRATLFVLIGGAVLLRLWLVFQDPALSGDVYRYIWDGRVVNAGFNPYLHVPADPELIGLRDPRQYGLIDKRDYAVTIYPPVAEALFAIVTRMSNTVVAMKLAMVLCEGVAVLAVMRLLVRLGRPVGLIAIYLLHPAPLWEIAGNGHVDAAMMAFFFSAFAWTGAAIRPYGSALLLTLGALVKPTAALGLPAVWRPVQVLLPLAVIAIALLCYLPFIGARTGVVGFLPIYLHEQGLDSGEGFYWLALLRHFGMFRPAMTAVYVPSAASLVLAFALWSRRNGSTDLRAALGGTALLQVLFMILISPTFPWYFLAVLPMAPLLGLWSPFALASGGFLLYGFNADAPPFFVRWSVMMGLTVLAAMQDWQRARQRKMKP